MRRIYESGALRRDDEEPHAPSGEAADRPQAMRSVPGGLLSRLFVPNWLRYRAISLSIATPREEFERGEPVPFRVTMKNAAPIPITVPTASPLLWNWGVDGHPEAAQVPLRDPPDERRGFRFDRGERKEFTKRWNGRFRVSRSEWETAPPGEHTVAAWINVADRDTVDLSTATTIRIE